MSELTTVSMTLQKIVSAYEALALTPPKAATDALTKWGEVSDWLHGAPPAENLNGLTAAEHIAIIERTAMRAAARTPEALSAANEQHEPAICAPGLAAMYGEADKVVAKLRDRYTKAASVVTGALGYYTADAFTEPTTLILTGGRHAAKLVFDVEEAVAELELVRALIELLGNADPRSARNVATFCDVETGAPPDTLTKAAEVFRGRNRWPALFATPHVAPALHTHAEAEDVVSQSHAARLAVEQEAEARMAEVKAERKAELQRVR